VHRAVIYLGLVVACSRTDEPRPERERSSAAHRAPLARDNPGTEGARAAEMRGPAADAAREPAPDPREPEPPRLRPTTHTGHAIEVVLRSSPPGATAAVDGVPTGPTPAYWAGQADGQEHEFTFVLAGHASARYRFVPITSGVIHARLEVLTDDTDAGVAEPARPVEPPRAPAVPAGTARSGAGPQP
jgi:hypothetical protein